MHKKYQYAQSQLIDQSVRPLEALISKQVSTSINCNSHLSSDSATPFTDTFLKSSKTNNPLLNKDVLAAISASALLFIFDQIGLQEAKSTVRASVKKVLKIRRQKLDFEPNRI